MLHSGSTLIIACVFAALQAFGQNPVLKPFIGLDKLPAETDPVCTIPVYKGDFDRSGYSVGDTVPDFTLYTRAGTGVNLREELLKGKPVLLIAGSYTCPVYRNRMNEINAVYAAFKNEVSIHIVYVVEAHPITDPSPYSGTEWVTSQNQTEGVLYRQPTTYGERNAVIDAMTARMNILPPILVDGPCNEWWTHFGPAPNNAYLIRTDGTVFAKHGWFNRAPANMITDIERLLGTGGGGGTTGFGRFTFVVEGSPSVTGVPGGILTTHATLTNPTTKPVHVKAQRQVTRMPAGWETAMCVDVCLSTEVDTVSFYIPPGSVQTFTLYFYTGTPNDTAIVRMRFTNLDSTANNITQNFRGMTTGVTSLSQPQEAPVLSVFPNPVSTQQSLSVRAAGIGTGTFRLFDALGREVGRYQSSSNGAISISVKDFTPGLYFYATDISQGEAHRGKLVIR